MSGGAASMAGPILKVEHLSMKFGGLVAIGDLSFEARRGEITALIGPNGAGKTTVFNCITGFYKPSEGMITLTRQSGSKFLLERMPDFEITAKAKVARTFQNIRLFSGMTLLENLLVAQHNKLMLASGYTVLGLFGLSSYRSASRDAIELARHWLEKAKLIDRADDPAGDLPYGAQRRLEIARAMCTGPELLCLDEPAAGLNPRESADLNLLLNDIKNTTGTSILLIEHDMSVVMQISDHVVVLEYGRKISDGNPEHVKNDPRVIAAYLGVDDEEVGDVLIEVGDDAVLEKLDVAPDLAHGPASSSSMMAGPVSDTIEHADPEGERITVSPEALRAHEAAASRAAAAASDLVPPPAVAETSRPAEQGTGSIFISYRRGDEPAFAGRLFDYLQKEFPSESLFLDVEQIDPGVDFVDVLQQKVANSSIFLVMIGRGWLDARNDAGERRIDNPEDFVRLEVEQALSSGKRVIPVLVNGATIPSAQGLPEGLKSLTRLHAVRILHESFKSDADALVKALKKALKDE